MGRTYAGIMGTLGFFTVTSRAVLHNAGAEQSLLTAVLAMFGLAGVGYVLGSIAQSTVEESVRTQIAGELVAQEAAAKRK